MTGVMSVASKDELRSLVFDGEWTKRFPGLMMVGVTQRYLLFYSLDFPANRIEQLNLTGSTSECLSSLQNTLYQTGQHGERGWEIINNVISKLLTAPLPEGIPDVT